MTKAHAQRVTFAELIAGIEIPDGHVIVSVAPYRTTTNQPADGRVISEDIVEEYVVTFAPEPAPDGCGTCHH